jgi:hypothetical protein
VVAGESSQRVRPHFRGIDKTLCYQRLQRWSPALIQQTATERLLTADNQHCVSRMRAEFWRIMEQMADAVNVAPKGNVISGWQMQARDLMAEFRRKAFETALQMRIDSKRKVRGVSPDDALSRGLAFRGPLQRKIISALRMKSP